MRISRNKIFFLLALTFVFTNGMSSASAQLTNHWYRITHVQSGKVVDVPRSSKANGEKIDVYGYYGTSNQKFRFEPAGGGYYFIINQNSGKALAVNNASKAAGARIVQWDKGPGKNDQIAVKFPGGGKVQLAIRHSGKFVSVQGTSLIQSDKPTLFQLSPVETYAAPRVSAESQAVNVTKMKYRVALRQIKCTRKASTEGGHEEELYGWCHVRVFGANGKELQPLDGGTKHRLMWKTTDSNCVELRQGENRPITAVLEYNLTAKDLKYGKLEMRGHIYEADSTSGDDDLGDRKKIYNLSSGENKNIPLDFYTEGGNPTKAQLKFSFESTTPTSHTLRLRGVPAFDKKNSLNKYVYTVTPLDINFPKFDRQQPHIHAVAIPVLSRGKAGQKFVHISLKGTTMSAGRRGILDIDKNTTRGFFLEKASVEFFPGGLSMVSNGPNTTSGSGSTTSTSGVDLGTGVGVSKDGPSMSLSGGMSFGQSYSENLTDFVIVNTGGSRDLRHDYKLAMASGKKYTKPHDLVVDRVFKGIQLHELPSLAKNNLPIISQATYVVPDGMENRTINFQVRLTMYLRWVDVMTDNITYTSDNQGSVYSSVITIPIDLSKLK